MADKPNGVYVEDTGGYEDESFKRSSGGAHPTEKERETLYDVLHRLITSIVFPESGNTAPLLRRIKISVSQNAPLIPEASRNTARDVLLWTRRGSPLRALLVISVGTITLVALTGLIVFMLFFLAATINAILISLLISLAAAGGFLALFFAFVTAIYIGALSVAIFTISTVTFWTVVAILITTGWIGFFWTVWLATKKSFGFAKHSLSVTGSAISTYTAARRARHLIHKGED
ncbi:voltage-dependent L-type calcium channel subunit [Senna tora]|uniref:Voltage-dependent L-type calcium channel subunit n=1 Tax=Senna tora TaxID=362788 RepID=A0A834T771_9FABA|nr:voltage-dependent L-type calcium channel subunit [Senna tora]